MIIQIQPNMLPIRDINDISKGDRLFYELGYKKDINNWIREGLFKEIEDVEEYLEGDKLLTDLKYLEHHNFMIIKMENK